MNEIDMVQAINGIDEKYISESENITNVSRKKRSFKIAIIINTINRFVLLKFILFPFKNLHNISFIF